MGSRVMQFGGGYVKGINVGGWAAAYVSPRSVRVAASNGIITDWHALSLALSVCPYLYIAP